MKIKRSAPIHKEHKLADLVPGDLFTFNLDCKIYHMVISGIHMDNYKAHNGSDVAVVELRDDGSSPATYWISKSWQVYKWNATLTVEPAS